MLICTGEKSFIFVHIPKTAGTTFTRTIEHNINEHNKKVGTDKKIRFYESTCVIDEVDHSHLCIYDIQRIHTHIDINIPIITIVRNPYDRIYSAFNFTSTGAGGGRYPNLPIFSQGFKSFVKNSLRTLVQQQLDKYKKKQAQHCVGIHFLPSYMFLTDKMGNMRLDNIIHQENFDNELLKVIKLFDMELNKESIITETYTNNPPSVEGQHINQYDDEMIQIINQIYYNDFKIFNYKMKSSDKPFVPLDFDWKCYLAINYTLPYDNEKDAIEHWLAHGYNNGIVCRYVLPINFDWRNYLQLNPDLTAAGILTEINAIRHWIYNGSKEKRKY